MLQHISWMNYWISVFLLTSGYYLYLSLVFFKKDLLQVFYRFTGRSANISIRHKGEHPFIAADVMGKVKPDDVSLLPAADISFAPPEDEEAEITDEALAFNEMSAEIERMITAIQHSGNERENFAMLFQLLTEKYTVLHGTAFQDQINSLVLLAATRELSLHVDRKELNNYWIKSN